MNSSIIRQLRKQLDAIEHCDDSNREQQLTLNLVQALHQELGRSALQVSDPEDVRDLLDAEVAEADRVSAALQELTQKLPGNTEQLRAELQEVQATLEKTVQEYEELETLNRDLLDTRSELEHKHQALDRLQEDVAYLQRLSNELTPEAVKQAWADASGRTKQAFASFAQALESLRTIASRQLDDYQRQTESDREILEQLQETDKHMQSDELKLAASASDSVVHAMESLAKGIHHLEKNLRNFLINRDTVANL